MHDDPTRPHPTAGEPPTLPPRSAAEVGATTDALGAGDTHASVPTLPTLPPPAPSSLPAPAWTPDPPAPTTDAGGVLLGVPTLPTLPPPAASPAPPVASPAAVVPAPPPAYQAPTKASLKLERKRARIRAGHRRSWLGTFLLWRLIAGGLVLAVTLGVAGVRAIQDRLADDDVTWDPRVTELVAFVEQERGLAFDHPVAIDFLAPEEYSARAGEDAAGYDAVDREYFANVGEVVNATGLAVGYDPIAGQTTITSAGTLGLYDPYSDEIWVRGADLDAPTRVTLVHELTHALQAQHFDLDRPDIGFAFRSIVEADAQRVELVYVDTLPVDDRQAVEDSYAIDPATDAAMATVPWAIRETFDAPYVLGPAVVDAAFAAGGNAAVDALLTTTPTEEILVSPWLEGTDQTELAPEVTEPDGATAIDGPRSLGMWETLVMLDAWLPWTEARGALDAWDGGGFVSYESATGTGACFSATVALDGDPAAFVTAIRHWAAASGSDAEPTTDGNLVSFSACSRGPAASEPAEPVIGPLFAAYLEAGAVEDFTTGGEPAEVAICVARQLIDHPDVAPLLALESLDASQTALFDSVRAAVHEGCAHA